MRPRPEMAHDDFRVFVYASFIPLHGLEHVVRAAAILEQRGEPVRIDLVGSGDTESSGRALVQQLGVRSITFVGRRPYDELPEWMARSDLCLGIFGTSPKAQRVIPNKVFDALACGARRPHRRHARGARAVRPGVDVWVCRPGDPEALADAIVTLRATTTCGVRLPPVATPAFARRRASTPSHVSSPPSSASSSDRRERRARPRDGGTVSRRVPHTTSEHAPTAHRTTTAQLGSGTAASGNRLGAEHVLDVRTVGHVRHAPLERPSATMAANRRAVPAPTSGRGLVGSPHRRTRGRPQPGVDPSGRVPRTDGSGARLR